MRKFLASVLSLCLLLLVLPVTTRAATYTDTAGNWAEDAIDRFSDYGVIQGNNGYFYPGSNLTRGQMAAIISRLMQLPEAESAGFTDVTPGSTFEDAINRCYAAGIMLGSNGKANPNASITREQAIVMLARALGIQEETDPDLSSYTDANKVPDYAKGYIAAMNNAGIVKGTSDTTLGIGSNITRAATVTILDRAISAYANEDGQTVTGSSSDTGIVLVVANNVTVTGNVQDVLVAQGSDGGSVTLQDANVTGTVTVNADAAVNLAGTTTAQYVMVTQSAKATVAVAKAASVKNVSVAGAESKLQVAGTVGTVTVSETASKATVEVASEATVSNVAVEAADSSLQVAGTVGAVTVSETASKANVEVTADAKVDSVAVAGADSSLQVAGTVGTVNVSETAENTNVSTTSGANISSVNSSADGVTVSGTGTVTSATISGDNNSVNTTGTNVTTAAGTSGTTANGKDVAAGSSTTSTGTSGTGTSSTGTTNNSATTSGNGNGNVSEYTVRFNSMGGSSVAAQSVYSGNTATSTTPTWNACYTFDAWYTDASLTRAYDFSTAVTGDITLYAGWSMNAHNWGDDDVCTVCSAKRVNTKEAFDAASAAVVLYYDGEFPESGNVGEGQQLKWSTGTDAYSSTMVMNGSKYIAIIGSDSFAGGNGSESYPYLIGTVAQLNAVAEGTALKTLYYKLTNNIDLAGSDYEYGVSKAYYIDFNGNGKKLSSSTTKTFNGLFNRTTTATLHDFTYDLTNLDVSSDSRVCSGVVVTALPGNLTLKNVTVTGSHSVVSNNAAFVRYEAMDNTNTLTFDGCVYAANLQGTGDGYNACFIGWQYPDQKTWNVGATIVFNNCSVTGSLEGQKSAIVSANGYNAYSRTYEYKGTNTISSTAVIRGTEVAQCFTPVSINSLSSNESNAATAFNVESGYDNRVYVGAKDAALRISADAEGNLTITPSGSDTVTSYVVQVGIYTHQYNGEAPNGTLKYFVKQTVASDHLEGLTLKKMGFVDKSYCDSEGIDTTEAYGTTIATFADGKEYYVIDGYMNGTNQGYVGSPTQGSYTNSGLIVTVTAYADDTVYSSYTLK